MLVAFHVQDERGRPRGGALIRATNEPHGDWAGVTNPCGDFLATLGAGHYDLTITHPGFAARVVPAELADSGIVTIGLEPGSRRARAGVVRLAGRVFLDDDGPYLAVGASLFWALWGYAHDRARVEQHLGFLAARGVDYIRVFGIIGPRWTDRMVDPAERSWDDNVAGLLDLAVSYGLRVELTIWQDTDLTADRMAIVDRLAAIASAIPKSIQYFEICNEGAADMSRFPPAWPAEAQRLADALRSKTPHLVAVTSPGGIDAAAIAAWYGQSSANLLTTHLPRDETGGGIAGAWRYVRQTWDPWLASALSWTNDEGKGPQSSVAADDDPLRLTMYAGLTWLCGGAGFVLHTGAGVGGGDEASKSKGRAANLWEVANIDPILAGIAAMRRLLPADLPNWSRHNANRNFPGYPFDCDRLVPLIETGQLLRAFAATSEDGRFIVMPIVAQAAVPFAAKSALHLDVYEPLTGEVVEACDRAAGEVYTLPATLGRVMMGMRSPLDVRPRASQSCRPSEVAVSVSAEGRAP